MNNKVISILLSAALMLGSAPSVYAENTPVISAQTPEKPLDAWGWKGGEMTEGSVYFSAQNIKLSADKSVPQGSMLVIEEGTLSVPAGKTLTVNGALVLHKGAKLNVKKGGRLVVLDGGIFLNYGTLAISKGGEVNNSGYLQSLGAVNVKGTLTTAESGTFSTLEKPVMKGGQVNGGYTLTAITDMRYYAETLDWKHNNVRTTYYYGGEFSEVEVLDGKHRAFAEDMRWVVRGFEGVLYELSENVVGEAPVCDCDEVFTAQISGEETEYCPPYSGRYCEITEDGTRTLEFPEGEMMRVLTYAPVLGIANEETISDMRCVIAEFGMGAGNPRAYVAPDGTEYEVSSPLYLFSRDSKGKTHILREYSSDIYALRCIKYLDRLKQIDSSAAFDASYGCAEEDMKLTAEGIYLTKTGRLAAVVKVSEADEHYEGYTPEKLNSALKKWGADSLYALCVLSPSALE